MPNIPRSIHLFFCSSHAQIFINFIFLSFPASLRLPVLCLPSSHSSSFGLSIWSAFPVSTIYIFFSPLFPLFCFFPSFPSHSSSRSFCTAPFLSPPSQTTCLLQSLRVPVTLYIYFSISFLSLHLSLFLSLYLSLSFFLFLFHTRTHLSSPSLAHRSVGLIRCLFLFLSSTPSPPPSPPHTASPPCPSLSISLFLIYFISSSPLRPRQRNRVTQPPKLNSELKISLHQFK